MHNASVCRVTHLLVSVVLTWCRDASFLAVSRAWWRAGGLLWGFDEEQGKLIWLLKCYQIQNLLSWNFRWGGVFYSSCKISVCRSPGNAINALPFNFLGFYYHNDFPCPVSNSVSGYKTLAAFSFAALGHGRAQGVHICVHVCMWPECWHPGRKLFGNPPLSPDLQN